ncbi:MAG: hypothetical protein QE273_11655 [Verrucomicrobiales bacterium]|nr:hypothetical protein [Verrucomicrobiales bacterium]
MQQTSIDRWLRKAFVYVCKVYCNTLPIRVPDGVTLEESGDDAAGRYRYCFTVSNDKQMSELTALLEVANITYTSRVSERAGTVSKLFNNPEKSFSLQVAWMIFISIIIAIAFSDLPVRIWTYLSADENETPVKKPAATAPAKP